MSPLGSLGLHILRERCLKSTGQGQDEKVSVGPEPGSDLVEGVRGLATVHLSSVSQYDHAPCLLPQVSELLVL